MKTNEKVLYGNGAYGINVWKIWSEGNIIHIEANGSRYREVIPEGKAGRSIDEQVKLRVDARVRSKMDGGFKLTKEEAAGIPTNQLNLALPMLATPYTNVRNLKLNNCYYQPKLDGHRCLITRQGSEIVAYSRRGKLIHTIGHIIDRLDIPDGVTLDGELYVHGAKLQTIASWAKRQQPDSARLKFHAYDLIDGDSPQISFGTRKVMLESLVTSNKTIEMVDTIKFNPEWSVADYYRFARDHGFEGAILRPDDGIYSIGKRAKHLIKVKMRNDAEFKCVDIIPSREDWGILILETLDGKKFKTLAPGPVYQKKKTLQNKGEYIGKYVTCEYAELTNDGIPFHNVAIRWRTDI